MRSQFTAAAVAALLGAPAVAQHLIAYDPPPLGPGLMSELQLPRVVFPLPAPPAPIYPIVPPLPPAPVAVPQPGDSTFNSITALSWYTNGFMLASMPTPSFPPAGPLMPPFPIAPGVIGAIGGPVTGIAINPVAGGAMFLVAAPGIVIGVAPIPGTPVVVPPFVPGFAMGPISGLEWDGISGSLYACDIAGVVYNFAVGGLPLGPPIVPFGALPGMAGDVAIDKTGALNAALVRSIYVTAGPMAVDITLPFAPPLPTGLAMPCGLAFLPKPASNTLGVACACGGILPVLATNSPMVTGNAGFAITVAGLPPGSPVITAYDFAYNPLLPLINVTGCGLGLAGTPALVFNLGFANAVGTATWPLPLTFLPPGLGPAWDQAMWPCTVDPFGFTLTDTQQLQVCGY